MDFEWLYFGFYFSDQANPFVYLIETDNNGYKKLTITLTSGDQAIYGDRILSNQDFHSSHFSIYINPVKNEEFLSSRNTLEKLNIKIFNIEGKLLSAQDLEFEKQVSVDIHNLSSGIYFLNIKDERGNTTIRKFVKE